MKKNLAILAIALVFVLVAFGTSTAWQGRMAGMGDPYGLVQDESDMLIHPAMIMNSAGTRFYTHYRFTYTDVMEWDYKWDFDFTGIDYDFNATGDEYIHEALLGSAFNLGSGRMGVFFTYENQNADYDGDVGIDNFITDGSFYLESDKNDFALSFLYGFPVDCTAIGFEAGFAYTNEENKIDRTSIFGDLQNDIVNITLYPLVSILSSTYPHMIPYDSEYYELFAKASVASELGCAADFGFTLNGGYIISGDNEIETEGMTLFGPIDAELDGDVEGWSLGGDFWLRYKVDDSLTLPFLVSTSFQKKKRNGDDSTLYVGLPTDFNYKHKEMTWNIEAGGGVDVALDDTDTSKIASGIYYQYIDSTNYFRSDVDNLAFNLDTKMDDIPDYDEHRITLKFAYEKEISPMIGFRTGVNGYYGWADWDYKNDSSFVTAGMGFRENVSMDGDLWGIGCTVGGTVKLDPFTLEPFIGFAYQRTELDGDGRARGYGGFSGINSDIDGESDRNQWLITTGASILF